MRTRSLRRARAAATTLAVLTAATVATSSAHAEPFLLTTSSEPARSVRPFEIPSSGLLSPLAGPFAGVGGSPVVAVVSPDGRSLYIGSDESSATPVAIRQYDVAEDGTTTPKSVPDVFTGSDDASSVVLTPDGRRAFAVDSLSGRAAVLDVDAGGRLENPRPIPGTVSPSDVTVSTDSRSVYVADFDRIRQYDLATDGTLTPKLPASVPVSQPGFAVVSPDGRALYLSRGSGSTSILQFDIDAEGRLTSTGSPVPAPAGPIAIAPDGRNLYAYAPFVATTTIHQFAVAPEDGTLTPHSPASVAFSGTASGMAVAPDGDSLYLTDTTNDRILQYTVTSGGTLAPKSPATVATGDQPRTLAVTPLTDLALSISSSPEPTAADEQVTYTVTVTNEQGTPVGAARVTTALPAGLTLVGASTPGGACTASGPVECDIAPLGQGQSTTVDVRARAVVPGTHDVGASVTGLAPDPDAANNADTGAVTVVPRARATTAPASEVAADGATLNGVATPSASATTAWFELGPTDAYGTTTPAVVIADGAPPSVVSATVVGLAPDTAYHYRLVVSDSTGATIRGARRTFTTAAAPTAPKQPEPERIETIRTVYVPVPTVPLPEADRTPPKVSRLALTPRSLRMRVSEAATVRATIAVRKTRRAGRGGKTRRGARWVVIHRGSARAASAGTATLAIPRRLVAGRYRVTVRAIDSAGNAGRELSATRTLRKARES